MTSPENIQSTFLEEVKKRLPPNLLLVDELSEILNVSRDSTYRRLRGETILSLDEVKKICNHFNVSLDALMAPTSEMVSFHNRAINHRNFTFEQWLKSVLHNLEMISSLPQKEITYYAKDIPLFHYFKFPELASFKMFFWMKSYLNYPQYANEKFRPELISKDLQAIGQKVWGKYANIPSTEIWSEETTNITLKQIEFYHESGVISKEQALHFCELHTLLINSIREEASSGSKNDQAGKFNMFKNEILIAETTIFFKMGDKRVAYITYNTMNVLTTSNESFCREIEDYLDNVRNKSIQISTSAEKERNKFFNKMDEKTRWLKETISKSM